MHESLGVHLAEALKDSMHDRSRLLRLELVLGLHLVIQLATCQQLENNVKGVLGLEDLMELHRVLMV